MKALVPIARLLATAGGVGYSPWAPGTCGTLVAVPLAWALAAVPIIPYAAVCALVTVVGIWAAGVADRSWGTHDSGRIVIDEVAGYLVTMIAVDRGHPLWILAGFGLFRLLDVTKPFPIRAIERRVPGGAGVVLDDVAAGVIAALLLFAGNLLIS